MEEPESDKQLAIYFAGLSTTTAIFTFFQALDQTRRVYRRSNKLLPRPYLALVWTEWTVNVVWGFLTYFSMMGVISQTSFGFTFSILCLWVLQTQCIIQIIVNRVSLIMYASRTRVARLKWGFVVLIGLINLSGYAIWVPAKMNVSDKFVRINDVWNRCEKVSFMVMDMSLQAYFVYLVRTNLVSNGLTKYRYLFRANVAMMFLSILMDVTLVGLLNLGNVYLTFMPVTYLMKLSIEMNMADLIAKIAKSSSRRRLGHHEQPFTETFNLPTPIPTSLMCSGLAEGNSAERSVTGTGRSCSSKEPEVECSVWDGCTKCRLGMPSLAEASREEEEGQEHNRRSHVSGIAEQV